MSSDHGTAESDGGLFVRKDPDDALRRLISLLRRSSGLVLQIWRQCALGKVPKGKHLLLGPLHQCGGLVETLGEHVRHVVPLGGDLFGAHLGEDRAERGRDHLLVPLGDVGQQVAGEVNPAALVAAPWKQRRMAATRPACWSEITSRTPDSPRRLSDRKNSRQKASSSESPISMPSISRRPSSATPVATTTALDVT